MENITNSICNTVLFDREVLAKKWIKEYQPQLTDNEVNNVFNVTDDYLKKRIDRDGLIEQLKENNVVEF